MIKVKVYAPPFCDHSRLDDQGCLSLQPGARLRDVYREIGVAALFRPWLFTAVNYKREKSSAVLQDGDVVSIFWPLSGG